MSKIPLQEAVEILKDCSAVIIDDYVLVYPSVNDLEQSDENEFMLLSYTEDGLEYYYKFYEGENQMVEVVGSNMFLVDGDKETIQLTILVPKNLEALKNP